MVNGTYEKRKNWRKQTNDIIIKKSDFRLRYFQTNSAHSLTTSSILALYTPYPVAIKDANNDLRSIH